ncbi:DUF1622 domain-containing protein [Mesorhizobium sp. RP14(2022)]|jgi:uncharacterized membrane protein|uniref:DUF1622 domain-containing protein n=1 Tax=Mesorhizobium liriopis TaxID=2953882 RepID=A0ABT1C8C0_9HYPH|nr:DUF1622 domain-containing protein [Mesorhizobium liriopis]MCO6051093.1 DUF1622 domain-containing protein [Mesorhizobium liriopis]
MGEAVIARGGGGLIDAALEWVSRGVEVAGVSVIVLGAVIAAVQALLLLRSSDTAHLAYHAFRQRLGRTILLGLELLVAADIIGTVAVEPTLQNVLILALIVLIRTFLSTSLTVEIEGRWPWSPERKETAS